MKRKHLLFVLVFCCAYLSVFSQSCLTEGIIFSTQTEVDNFPTDYPGCTHIGGTVIFDFSGIDDITNLNALSQIERISGDLVFESNLGITNLEGLENLDVIEGELRISQTSLLSLNGLDGLDTIGGNFFIDAVNSVADLSALGSLKYIAGDFMIHDAAIGDFVGMEALEQIGGSFNFQLGVLNSFEGLNSLTSIGGELFIDMPSGLTGDLSGLDALQSVGGGVSIVGTGLSSLGGLENLNDIGGSLFIHMNDNLTDISALANINLIAGTSVEISLNHSLELCAEPVICNYLLSGNEVNVHANGAGCNSVSELELACANLNLASVHFNVFYDLNQNKIQDQDEVFYPDAGIVVSPIQLVSYTNSTNSGGVLYLEDGNYTISYDASLTPNWALTTDSSSFFISLSDSNTSDTINFGIYPTVVHSEMITTISSALTRCGEWVQFDVYAKNIGTTITEGTMWLDIDTNITGIDLITVPSTVEDDLLGWDFENLYPGESVSAQVLLQIPGPLEFNLGDTLHFGSYIGFTVDGGIYSSRYFNYDPIVRCSYDPNDKLVQPQREGNYTLFEEDLFYTIRFQNTGNDVAYDVFILDTLDAHLDPSTFRVLNTSHPHVLKTDMEANRYLRFDFQDIFLPDSTANFDESQGFVSYMISPKAGLAEETLIENTASIYFDFNPPVVTNTTENLMVSELPMVVATHELNQEKITITIFPNPSNGQVELYSESLVGAVLELKDLTGRTLLQQSFSVTDNLDLKNYPNGVYFISFKKDGHIFTEKLVKY